MTDHARYIVRCQDQSAVATAMRAAAQMIERTQHRLQAVNVPEDPRVGVQSLRQALAGVFKVQPGNSSMGQLFEIRQNFQLLAQAAANARSACVSGQHPMCGKADELGHSAFAVVGTDNAPTLYICPSFFHESARDQARTIVHELAHARLAIGHRGGEIVAFGSCPDLPLRSFSDAIANAYAYDAFADCMGGASAAPTRAGAGAGGGR